MSETPAAAGEGGEAGSVVRYFIATFVWSWTLIIPAVLVWRGKELAEAPWWSLVLLLLAAYGPTVAALLLTARDGGREGVRRLLSRFRIWRVGARWYLVVLLTPPLMALAGLALYTALHGVAWTWDLGELVLLPLGFVLALPFGPLAEELGWRGYALPRLLRRSSAFAASLVLGVVWTAWHIPLFWAPAGTTISGTPVTPSTVLGYLALLTGYSVLYTWVYQHTGGSVWMAFLFHASFNTPYLAAITRDMSREAARDVELLSTIPLWIVVFVVVVAFGPTRLRR